MEQIQIKKRDVVIGYSVDLQSVTEMSNEYGITPKEMKSVIRACGLKIRKVEEKVIEPVSNYKIVLEDQDGKEIEISDKSEE